MNVLLVFPPVFNPTQPYLGPFKLAGALRHLTDWRIDVLDWSVQSYRLLLEPDFITRVASRQGIDRPVDLIAGVRDVRQSLKQPDDAYRGSVIAIDQIFSWYASAFPRIRLFRYCGVEAVDWHVDASQDLIAFAEREEQNVFSMLYDDLVRPRIERTHYDAVGLTLVCEDQLAATATLAIKLRQQRRRPRVVIGGPLASMLATRSRRSPFVELFDDVYVGSATPAVRRALAPRESHGDRPLAIEWIRPDWSGVDWDAYVAPAPVIPIHTTAGCPFNCRFCSSPAVAMAMEGVRFRQRCASDVVAEMEGHVAEGHRYFLLVGEMLTWTHAAAVAEAVAARGLENRVVWYFWTRVSPAPPPGLLKGLRERGCRRICLGLETADSQAMTNARKQARAGEAAETLRSLVRADIQPHLFLMTGLPGQDRAASDAGLLLLLNDLVEAGAYAITTTVSPFKPEEWSPWHASAVGLVRPLSTRRDLSVTSAATLDAEEHAATVREMLRRRLAEQPYLGAFGNAHQLVFLDRYQAHRAGPTTS